MPTAAATGPGDRGREALRRRHALAGSGAHHREGRLGLFRPAWHRWLTTRKRLRPLLLKDIRRDLPGPRRLPLEQILSRLESLPTLPPLDERVAACILGLPRG